MAGDPGSGGQSFFTEKLGPLPMVAWIGIAGVVFYFFYERSKKAAAAPAPLAGSQTAANGTTVDPVTGYLQGSAADVAALSSMYDLTATSATSSNTTATYQTNNAWGVAAVSYIAGLGENSGTASKAVSKYLAAGQLTPQEQQMVNAATQAIGPPPVPPAPASTAAAASATNTAPAGQAPQAAIGPPQTMPDRPTHDPMGRSHQPPPDLATQTPSRKPVPGKPEQPPGPPKKPVPGKRQAPAQGAPVPAWGSQPSGAFYPNGVPVTPNPVPGKAVPNWSTKKGKRYPSGVPTS